MSSNLDQIRESASRLLRTIPPEVQLIAAAKTRTIEEVKAVIQAGVKHIGYNYVQEAVPIIQGVNAPVTWHMIGHLQRNKARLAVEYFDMVETVDSWRLAQALERRCASLGKILPVLVEINSGRESNKTGVLPEDVDLLVIQMAELVHLRVQGLMTMGPSFGNPEDSRPYFKASRRAFERLKAMELPNLSMQYLSMGMSNSYEVAIEEGANMVRIGTKLFGPR